MDTSTQHELPLSNAMSLWSIVAAFEVFVYSHATILCRLEGGILEESRDVHVGGPRTDAA